MRRRFASIAARAPATNSRTRSLTLPIRPYPGPTRVESRASSDGLGDPAALQAAGAHVGPGRRPLEQDADPLEVGVEAALRGDHRVRAVVPERGLLAADCADLAHGGPQCSRYAGSAARALLRSRANRSAISSAARTASAAFGMRASACSTVSTVST